MLKRGSICFGVYDIRSSRIYQLSSVEKCSPITKTWNTVNDIPDNRIDFCVCAFFDKIYLFGGFKPGLGNLNSYLQFNTK